MPKFSFNAVTDSLPLHGALPALSSVTFCSRLPLPILPQAVFLFRFPPFLLPQKCPFIDASSLHDLCFKFPHRIFKISPGF